MTRKKSPLWQAHGTVNTRDGDPQLCGLFDFGLSLAGNRVLRYSQHEGVDPRDDRESTPQRVTVEQQKIWVGIRTTDAGQRSALVPMRAMPCDKKQRSLTDRFRNPLVGYRIAAVGIAFAMPGTLAGAMVGLFVGGAVLGAIVGSIVGTGFGVWLEAR